MVATPSRDTVEAYYNGQPVTNGEIAQDDADTLIASAVSMLENLFQDQVLLKSEVQDPDEAVKYLACHKWAVSLGDTVQSESQAGGSVTYNVPTATERSLRRTSYGLEFLEYLQSEPNVGLFSTT